MYYLADGEFSLYARAPEGPYAVSITEEGDEILLSLDDTRAEGQDGVVCAETLLLEADDVVLVEWDRSGDAVEILINDSVCWQWAEDDEAWQEV